MSKLMSDLNSLNESRKENEDFIIEEVQENQEQVHVVPEYKGIYFLSFLMILLISFSVVSLSISLKTFSQLEESWADSKTILSTLNKQQKGIAALQSLITDTADERLAQAEDVTARINELKVVMKGRENELFDMKVAFRGLKSSTQKTIDKLKLSDELMLKKYILLNDQFEKFREESLFISNTY